MLALAAVKCTLAVGFFIVVLLVCTLLHSYCFVVLPTLTIVLLELAFV
jgi:hypothetical protein